MKKMKKITAWRQIVPVKNEKGEVLDEKIIFNHIEDGWSDIDYPLPVRDEYKNQHAWKELKWEKQHAYLNENYVVVYEI